jgi:hypothetical protein
VQIDRLRQKITKIDEKLERKQPRIVVPKSSERGIASSVGGGSSTRRKLFKIKGLLNELRSRSQNEEAVNQEPFIESKEIDLEYNRSEYSSDTKEEVKMAVERELY